MIRDATTQDIPILLHMGEQFFNASGFDKLTTYDRESTKQSFLQLLKDGILLVGEVDGIVVGMVGAVIYPFYFNSSHVTGQEMFWWVEPNFRKSGVGMNLLKSLEQKAVDMGASSFSMVGLENINPKLMGKVYKMNGYFPTEHSYYKRLK